MSGRADVASAQLSSHRGRQDGRIHKYCSRSTLPVENSSGNGRIRGLSAGSVGGVSKLFRALQQTYLR